MSATSLQIPSIVQQLARQYFEQHVFTCMLKACMIALFVNAILQRRTTENNEVLYQVLACNPTGISYNKTWWCGSYIPPFLRPYLLVASFVCKEHYLSYFSRLSGKLLFLYIYRRKNSMPLLPLQATLSTSILDANTSLILVATTVMSQRLLAIL